MMTDNSVLATAAAGLGIVACCALNRRSASAESHLSSQKAAELKKQLVEEGYCVVPAAMNRAEIAEIAEMSHELLEAPENQQFQEDKFTGSLVPLSKHPNFAKLIAHRATLGALSALGFKPPRWLSGFIISKPPGGPSLGWHQDGWYWDEDVAYARYPVQLFAMYYLQDTTRANGCLRVIPRSHVQEMPLHKIIGAAHSTEVREADHTKDPAHMDAPGAVDVEVKAGDLVLGDARMLHAAHPNKSDKRRTLITMWYLPEYDKLPAQMVERIGNLHIHQVGELYKTWPEQAVSTVRSLVPDHDTAAEQGAADSYDHNLDYMVRDPGWVLRNKAAEAKWRECTVNAA